MFRRVSDFLETWSQERENTLKLLRALDDRSLTTAQTDSHRSLGRLAWHLTTTLGEMMERTGLKLGGPAQDAPVPKTAAEIVAAYETASSAVAEQVAKSWTDANLETEDDMYGERWPRRKTLQALVAHEIHHRGQMTVLMRLAGLAVPGIYGPSRDEWASFGMTPPAV